ncbi:MAG TPA: YfhO family protein [Rhodothermales bacterium]|nr:YfhO family protein [Rhodothermales bacterium]
MARKKSKRTSAPQAAGQAPTVTWWEGLSGSAQHGVCLILLLIVAVSFFAPALFSDKALIGGDTIQWRATAQAMLDYKAETGEEALWAPNTFAGMPGYLISFPKKIPQIDIVPQTLRAFMWPVSHFIFLLLGAYLLVHFLTRDKLSSVLAACAYGLTTYLPILLIAGHNTKFIALCFAPWLVLAFVYALRKPGLLAGLLFAIALAVHLRANHVQITYYVTFLMGIWWIVEGVGAFRRGEVKSFAVATGWLALGSVLALLMIAQPYLSTFEYKNFSTRGATTGGGEGGLGWDYAMAWSQGLGELVTLLMAGAYGGGSPTYWGAKTFTGGPHYVGGIVLLLALIALWRYRRNVVWALGISTLAMILFSLGENLEFINRLMFNVFPLFSSFRVPETWLSVAALALALLAGLGLFYVVRREPTPEAEAEKTRATFIAAGIMVGLVLLLFLGKSAFFDFERPNEGQQIAAQIVQSNPGVSPDDPRVQQTVDQFLRETRVERIDLFDRDAWRTLIFLLLATTALFLYRREKLPAWALQSTLILLVVVDLFGVGRRYFNEDLLKPVPDVEANIPQTDYDQFILQAQAEAGGPGHFRVLSLEGNLSQTGRPSFFYESLSGYHGAKLQRFQDWLDHLFIDPTTQRISDNALDLLNTRYVVAQGQLPGMEVVYQDQKTGFAVNENPDAVPRAFFVGETEVIGTPEETWARIHDEIFDPRTTAILPEAIDFITSPIDSASTVSVALERFSPREIVWNIETDAPRLLVASEIYYPAGWNAYVDGELTPIYRADYLLRAVPVPAGAHTVEMRFEPSSYRNSLWVTGLSTLFVYGGVIVLLALAWRRRREPDEASTEVKTA